MSGLPSSNDDHGSSNPSQLLLSGGDDEQNADRLVSSDTATGTHFPGDDVVLAENSAQTVTRSLVSQDSSSPSKEHPRTDDASTVAPEAKRQTTAASAFLNEARSPHGTHTPPVPDLERSAVGEAHNETPIKAGHKEDDPVEGRVGITPGVPSLVTVESSGEDRALPLQVVRVSGAEERSPNNGQISEYVEPPTISSEPADLVDIENQSSRAPPPLVFSKEGPELELEGTDVFDTRLVLPKKEQSITTRKKPDQIFFSSIQPQMEKLGISKRLEQLSEAVSDLVNVLAPRDGEDVAYARMRDELARSMALASRFEYSEDQRPKYLVEISRAGHSRNVNALHLWIDDFRARDNWTAISDLLDFIRTIPMTAEFFAQNKGLAKRVRSLKKLKDSDSISLPMEDAVRKSQDLVREWVRALRAPDDTEDKPGLSVKVKPGSSGRDGKPSHTSTENKRKSEPRVQNLTVPSKKVKTESSKPMDVDLFDGIPVEIDQLRVPRRADAGSAQCEVESKEGPSGDSKESRTSIVEEKETSHEGLNAASNTTVPVKKLRDVPRKKSVRFLPPDRLVNVRIIENRQELATMWDPSSTPIMKSDGGSAFEISSSNEGSSFKNRERESENEGLRQRKIARWRKLDGMKEDMMWPLGRYRKRIEIPEIIDNVLNGVYNGQQFRESEVRVRESQLVGSGCEPLDPPVHEQGSFSDESTLTIPLDPIPDEEIARMRLLARSSSGDFPELPLSGPILRIAEHLPQNLVPPPSATYPSGSVDPGLLPLLIGNPGLLMALMETMSSGASMHVNPLAALEAALVERIAGTVHPGRPICEAFRATGGCGNGLGCQFLHLRSDGVQLN